MKPNKTIEKEHHVEHREMSSCFSIPPKSNRGYHYACELLNPRRMAATPKRGSVTHHKEHDESYSCFKPEYDFEKFEPCKFLHPTRILTDIYE